MTGSSEWSGLFFKYGNSRFKEDSGHLSTSDCHNSDIIQCCLFSVRIFTDNYMWPDFGKPTIYTQMNN